jgi:hypothetical protein
LARTQKALVVLFTSAADENGILLPGSAEDKVQVDCELQMARNFSTSLVRVHFSAFSLFFRFHSTFSPTPLYAALQRR